MILFNRSKKNGNLSWIIALVLFLGSCLPRQATVTPTAERHPVRSDNNRPVLTDASDAIRNANSRDNSPHSIRETYAEVLGVAPRELKNTSLYELIHEWMGVPHRLGGQTKNGIDCSAFVTIAMKEIYGKEVPRTAAQMANQVKRKYERQLQEGDLVFFSFGNRQIDHVGIYLVNGKFVHVSTSKGLIISRLQDNWYYKYFQRAGPI